MVLFACFECVKQCSLIFVTLWRPQNHTFRGGAMQLGCLDLQPCRRSQQWCLRLHMVVLLTGTMGERTTLECVQYFTRRVVDIYGPTYLKQPNEDDIARLLGKVEQRGFSGMIGSIDSMHWEWENCPTAWQGQYRGHFKKPTLILEAVASYDLWIWCPVPATKSMCCIDLLCLTTSLAVGPIVTF
jgi:hypothetical protein